LSCSLRSQHAHIDTPKPGSCQCQVSQGSEAAHSPTVEPKSVRFSSGMTVKPRSATRGQTFQPACIMGQKSYQCYLVSISISGVQTCVAWVGIVHTFCTSPKMPALSFPRNAASAAIYPAVLATAPID